MVIHIWAQEDSEDLARKERDVGSYGVDGFFGGGGGGGGGGWGGGGGGGGGGRKSKINVIVPKIP